MLLTKNNNKSTAVHIFCASSVTSIVLGYSPTRSDSLLCIGPGSCGELGKPSPGPPPNMQSKLKQRPAMQLRLQKQLLPHHPETRSPPSPRLFLIRNSGAAREFGRWVLLAPSLTDKENECEELRYWPPGSLAEPALEPHVSATSSPQSEFGGLSAFLCAQLWARCLAQIFPVEGEIPEHPVHTHTVEGHCRPQWRYSVPQPPYLT